MASFPVAMQKRVRSNVQVVKDDDGLQLVDHLTGAQFQLEDEYAFLLNDSSAGTQQSGAVGVDNVHGGGLDKRGGFPNEPPWR